MAEPLRAMDSGARACASNPTPEDRWLQQLHRKAERQRREEMDRQRKEHLRKEKERKRAEWEEKRTKRESSALRTVIRKAEFADRLVVKLVIPKDKEYQYTCSNFICHRTRVVFTRPSPGWECSDGGYVCRRRYKCKSCPRPFRKEGDSDDEYECKDVGKECMRLYTCKSCPRRFFTDDDLPEEEVLCRKCAFQRWCRNQVEKNREN